MKSSSIKYTLILMLLFIIISTSSLPKASTSNKINNSFNNDPNLFSNSINVPLNYSHIGIQPTCIIPIKFEDMQPKRNLTDIIDLIRIAAKDYFPEVSYGLTEFNISMIIENWLLMPRPMSYYAIDTDQSRMDLINDVISISSQYVNLRNYPRVIIVHAGRDEALTNNSSDILSFATVGELEVNVNGVTCKISFAIISEYDPLGIIVHEMAHMIGLPDLYDYSGNREFVGKWDLMGKGLWNGVPIGSCPAQLSSVCKISLGWIPSNSIITVHYGEAVEVTLKPLDTSSGIRVIKIPIESGVYYLIEARRKRGYDEYLPGEGVLIYFINESIPPGNGLVKIIDAKPSTSTLNDAYFTVNKIWRDKKHNLIIKILEKENSAYRILVSYNSTIIIDRAEVTRSRADIGSIQKVMFHAKWNRTNIDAKNIILEVNGTKYTTDNEGWITIQVTSDQICKQKWIITNVLLDDIQLPFIMVSDPPSIIWDKVIIQLSVPPDKIRINVNTNATIYCKAYYAYDGAPFEGEIVLNSTTIWNEVGIKYFTVKKIYDHKYGLGTFESNIVKIHFDALKIEAYPNKPIYNPNELVQLNIKLMYASDNKPISGGIINCNGTNYITGLNGMVSVSLKAPKRIGYFNVFIEGVSDGFSVNIPYNRLTLTLVSTKVLIDKIIPNKARVGIDKPIKVYFHTVWAHNKSSISSVVLRVLDRTLITNETGWASIALARSSISKIDLIVLEVKAPMNIISFEQLVDAYVIWDEIDVSFESYSSIPGSAKIIIKLRYVYDGEPIENAKVYVNKFPARNEGDGVYTKVVYSWSPYLTINVKIELENFDTIRKPINIFLVGNSIIYSSAIILIIFVLYSFIKGWRIPLKLMSLIKRIKIPRFK